MSTPELDERQRTALRFDLISQIASEEMLGERYGLGGKQGLDDYLRRYPAFADEVARMRSLFNSDMSVQERARLKGCLASEEALPYMFDIIKDPRQSPSTKVDVFKQINRMGGVDGLPPASKEAASGGTSFNLVINMPDGRQEKILTTTIEAEPEKSMQEPHDFAREARAEKINKMQEPDPSEMGEKVRELIGGSSGFWAE